MLRAAVRASVRLGRAHSTTAEAFRHVVMQRHAAAAFDATRDVPEAILEDVMQLTRRAPSSFNIQPWTCVLVRSAAQRELVGRAALSESNRRRVMDAPLTAVFCADLEPAHALPRVKAEAVARGKDARQVEDLELAVGYYATHGKLASLVKGVAANALSPVAPAPQPEGRKAWAYKSAMLAAQTYLLAATAHGLATAPMEGFDAARLRAYLDVPARYALPLVVATGYAPAESPEPPPSPRLDVTDLFFEDRFGARPAGS